MTYKYFKVCESCIHNIAHIIHQQFGARKVAIFSNLDFPYSLHRIRHTKKKAEFCACVHCAIYYTDQMLYKRIDTFFVQSFTRFNLDHGKLIRSFNVHIIDNAIESVIFFCVYALFSFFMPLNVLYEFSLFLFSARYCIL